MFSFEKLVAGPILEKTGFSVRAASSGVQMLKGRFWADNLILENPAIYPVQAFVDIASMTADLRWRLGQSSFEISSASVRARRITGVRTRDGRVNFAHFREGLERRGTMSSTSGVDRAKQLKVISLSLDEVEIIDYRGGAPERRIFPVRFDERWEKISLRESALVLLSALSEAGLSREDAIFASILPECVWTELLENSAKEGPGT